MVFTSLKNTLLQESSGHFMLKWLHRKYLSTGGRMLSAFGGRFERHGH